MDLHSLDAYFYDLPADLIAAHPLEPRDSSRLMILERDSGNISEIVFRDIASLLQENDSLVFNDTRVIPARLHGIKDSGAKIEIFLLEQNEDKSWRALAKPARKLRPSSCITFSKEFSCQVIDVLEEGVVNIKFHDNELFERKLTQYGNIPLPQYIKRSPTTSDLERYQTVYAKNPGAVAAPTAGLHFTKELLETISLKGISTNYITLHVGLGTFKPVLTQDIRDHKMHDERFHISKETANSLNQRAKDRRQICVGTTCCRTLEAVANEEGLIVPYDGRTEIFIYPGYKFKYVQSLLTNFHLPGSTLLMLVSAFAGYDLIKEAYKKAIKERYRFYSYGDAMLII